MAGAPPHVSAEVGQLRGRCDGCAIQGRHQRRSCHHNGSNIRRWMSTLDEHARATQAPRSGGLGLAG
eukprot:5358644-Prymnesium_polylepis.1